MPWLEKILEVVILLSVEVSLLNFRIKTTVEFAKSEAAITIISSLHNFDNLGSDNDSSLEKRRWLINQEVEKVIGLVNFSRLLRSPVGTRIFEGVLELCDYLVNESKHCLLI
jgi:hypothetical protein